jgi:hypothetical protein
MPTGTAARKAPRFRRTHLCGQVEDRQGLGIASPPNDPHSSLSNLVGRQFDISHSLALAGGIKCNPDASRSLFDAVTEMTGLTPLVRELEARLKADVESKDVDA